MLAVTFSGEMFSPSDVVLAVFLGTRSVMGCGTVRMERMRSADINQ